MSPLVRNNSNNVVIAKSQQRQRRHWCVSTKPRLVHINNNEVGNVSANAKHQQKRWCTATTPTPTTPTPTTTTPTTTTPTTTTTTSRAALAPRGALCTGLGRGPPVGFNKNTFIKLYAFKKKTSLKYFLKIQINITDQ